MFRSRKANCLKLIYWDGSDIVLAYKRLAGRAQVVKVNRPAVSCGSL
ncbi:hypothetical protein HJB89_26145 [Rhizobium sp. NZLR8]|nr:hypothetical protein [Rhizobium sp. NZLR8]